MKNPEGRLRERYKERNFYGVELILRPPRGPSGAPRAAARRDPRPHVVGVTPCFFAHCSTVTPSDCDSRTMATIWPSVNLRFRLQDPP